MKRRIVPLLLLALGVGGAVLFLRLDRQPKLALPLAEFLRACDAPDASEPDVFLKTALEGLSGWGLEDFLEVKAISGWDEKAGS